MELKGFDKKKTSIGMNFKHNKDKYIQYGTLGISILVLVIAVVCLSFALYTSENTFSAYNANVVDFYEGQYNLAVYLNGVKQDTIPTRTYDDNGVTKTAYVRNISCNNGATGRWDTELWSLSVDGATKTGTKCEIYFDNDTTLADNTTYATKYNPFPVGYVFLSTENNYASTLQDLFGGTWVKMDDNKVLRTGGGTGGSDTATITAKGAVQGHTLTVNEIASHSHTFTGSEVTTTEAGAHTHTRGTMDITGYFWTIKHVNYNSSNYGGAFSYSQTGTWKSEQTQNNNGYYVGAGVDFIASRNWTGATSSNGNHNKKIY